MASQIAYPVKVEAQLSDQLSRWLWLVKWVLVIPHYVVLAFLWIAFFATSIAAFFAILFTGRYPRGIFEFNVGVLRWSWRVAYYAYGALGTDRYPPFTLDEVIDYPAHLEIAYPEKLSRGLVLVKWWLLALPHYLVVGLLVGGMFAVSKGEGWEVGGFGLIGLLAVVAGVMLASTGRYPLQLFELVLGLNRWVLRVAAYAALMTDAYPPFRLDMGGTEPGDTMAMPPPASSEPLSNTAAAPAQASASTAGTVGWSAGPIVALSLGCLFAITSLGVASAGGLALWADQTQREDGFVTSPTLDLSTDAHAIVTEHIEIHAEGPDWVLPESILGDARVRVAGSGETFVGVGPSAAVRRYLTGVSYSFAPDLSTYDGLDLAATPGEAPASAPADQNFWIASSEGSGMRSITWPVSNGNWSLVVMNPDAEPGLSFEADVGAEAPALRPVGVGLLIGGGIFLLVAIALIVGAVTRTSRRQRRAI